MSGPIRASKNDRNRMENFIRCIPAFLSPVYHKTPAIETAGAGVYKFSNHSSSVSTGMVRKHISVLTRPRITEAQGTLVRISTLALKAWGRGRKYTHP